MLPSRLAFLTLWTGFFWLSAAPPQGSGGCPIVIEQPTGEKKNPEKQEKEKTPPAEQTSGDRQAKKAKEK